MNRMQKEWKVLGFLMLAFSCAVLATPAEDAVEDEAVDQTEQAADAAIGPDTSGWGCEFCPWQYGYFGSVDFGTIYVSDQSDIFERYTGLSEGWQLLGDGSIRYMGENGQYWDVDFQDLGLTSRRIEGQGGRQGSYKFRFGYRQLPNFVTQGAATPFLGSGTGLLVLPDDWVSATSTDGMATLGDSLRPISFGTERETFDMGVLFNAGTEHWSFGVDYRHETKDGIRPFGGAFAFTGAAFAAPVDYVTDQVDVVAAYAAKDLQAEFGYYGSVFNQGEDSLTWQNPFDPVVPGGVAGRAALEPDNQFHQIFTTIHWRASDRTDAVASASFGTGKQDESLLPYTINPLVNAEPLIRTSADGKVLSSNANLKLTTRPTDRLRLKAEYRFSKRDNETTMSEFDPVVTDAFVNPITQTNLPYSFQRNNGELSFDYRFAGRHKVEFGYDRLSYRRTFQDITQTRQDTLFGQIDIFKGRRFDMNLKLAWSERDGSAYNPNEDVNPPENPGMRRYNMADRERSTAKLFFMAMPSDSFNFGGGFEWADDNYGAEYGRTSGEYSAYNLDASWTPTSNVVVFGWYTYEDIEAAVDGNDRLLGDSVDWFANTRDELETFGVGIEAQKIADKWDLGLDFNKSRTTGAYDVQIADDPTAPFPELLTNLESLRLYATYAWREKWGVGFNARYDRFHSDDWALDNVDADTIFNVLTLGNEAPDYDVWVFGVWVRYAF